MTADHTDGDVARDNEFYEDFEVPSPRATNEDYRRSGWSRGHMCPAGDNKWDEKAMQESNLLTNICPQNSELNSGVWNVMPWGLVNDTSALESEINHLVYPLGSAAYMSEASLKNSMV